jgi:hypothetical protein
MKRSMSWALLIFIISFCAVGGMAVHTVAYADNSDPGSFIDGGGTSDGIDEVNEGLEQGGRSVYSIIKTGGNVGAFVVLAAFAIQLIFAGKNSNRRLELKDQMKWYLAGAVVLFSTRGIYKLIYSVGKIFGN